MKMDLGSILDKLREKLPRWINFQNLLFLSVIFTFFIIVLWSENISMYFESVRMRGISYTSTPTILPGTPTPLPAEWIASAEQTNGIIIGVVIILITIIIGTGVILIRDRE